MTWKKIRLDRFSLSCVSEVASDGGGDLLYLLKTNVSRLKLLKLRLIENSHYSKNH